jgi:hypothetical protein
MICTIIAIDEQDEVLGDFFSECLQDLENFENDKTTLSTIKSKALNEAGISLSVPADGKFVFLAYSHGSENELLASGAIPYVSDTINTTLFRESFFYTCSCSTGMRLGQSLIENKCSSYIGYKGKFEVWDYNRQPFVECANHGYKLFIQGENIESIIIKMKEKYDEHIANYNNDFFGAVILLANKKALVALGDFTHCLENISS